MDAFINEDAEKALIGLAMQDDVVSSQVAALPEKLFAVPEMRACQRAVARIVKAGRAPDLLSMDKEVQCDFSDTALLMDCAGRGVSPAQCRQLVAILEEAAKRRELRSLAEHILLGVSNPGASVDALVEECASVANEGVGITDNITMQEAVTALVNSFDKPDALMCGVADIDRLVGGFRPGQLIYLGARPGVGKSALALYMAKYAAEHGNGVLMITLEMSDVEIAARVLANEARFDLQRMTTNKLDADDFARLVPFCQPVSALPILINERARTPLLVRRAALKARQMLGNLRLIVVDYIQLMNADSRCGSRNDEVAAISRELKLLASDLGIPVLCLTQFNRLSTGTNKGRRYEEEPDMAQARDSGAIEQDANVFMVLHEPPEPVEEGTREWNAYFNCMANGSQWMTCRVQKNRNGRTGLVDLAFTKSCMRFASFTLADKEERKNGTTD